jgi:hypothetical protein
LELEDQIDSLTGNDEHDDQGDLLRERFEERAAILQYEAGFDRKEAEERARAEVYR